MYATTGKCVDVAPLARLPESCLSGYYGFSSADRKLVREGRRTFFFGVIDVNKRIEPLPRVRTVLKSGATLVKAATSLIACSLMIVPVPAHAATMQTSSPVIKSSAIPANWRDINDGVGGYPAGPMLEIAVRHTHADKLEMFKWRSEFVAMLGAQPGPLIEREWHSIWATPENTGAGTWTGMTWWENQQRWQDMANVVFSTPVAANWLKTLDMTLIFVKPVDGNFDLSTLAQSGTQVLELGVLAFPTSGRAVVDAEPAEAKAYLDSLKKSGAELYRFSIYKNLTGLVGPYTAAYNKSGPPDAAGEKWYVYMATYNSPEARKRIQSNDSVVRTFNALNNATVKAHSDIQVMSRTTSKVCVKGKTQAVSLDPDECHVGAMGSGDSWAGSYGERPQPCVTAYDVYSLLPPKTCLAVGGRRVDARPAATRP